MGTPVSSNNKTDSHNMTEILLKVPLKLDSHSHNKNVGQSCQTMLAIKVLCIYFW